MRIPRRCRRGQSWSTPRHYFWPAGQRQHVRPAPPILPCSKGSLNQKKMFLMLKSNIRSQAVERKERSSRTLLPLAVSGMVGCRMGWVRSRGEVRQRALVCGKEWSRQHGNQAMRHQQFQCKLETTRLNCLLRKIANFSGPHRMRHRGLFGVLSSGLFCGSRS